MKMDFSHLPSPSPACPISNIQPQHIDLLIHARWICPIAPDNIVLNHHSLAVHQGNIVDLLPTTEAVKLYQARETHTLNDHALLPGFVNAHTHAAMNLLKGLADDLALMEWLNNHIWPAEQACLSPEFVADGSLLAMAEMIRSGTTCFSDHYFYPLSTARVLKQVGLRAALGAPIFDLPTPFTKNSHEAIDLAVRTFDEAEPHALITWMLCPHAPYSVEDSAFRRIAAISAERLIRVHLHLHESEAEIQQSLTQYKARPIARLDNLGLMNDQLIAVHMVHLTPEEIELVQARQTKVVHCVEANLKLGNGLAPFAQLYRAGVIVGLGTDGAASNNDLNMLGELRTATLLTKGRNQDPTFFSAAEALKIATLGGATVLGLEQRIGSLEIGKSADMIAIDLSDIATQPTYNPISQIVYAANRHQITDVWVAGQALLTQQKLTTIDPAQLQHIIHHYQPKILAATQQQQPTPQKKQSQRH